MAAEPNEMNYSSITMSSRGRGRRPAYGGFCALAVLESRDTAARSARPPRRRGVTAHLSTRARARSRPRQSHAIACRAMDNGKQTHSIRRAEDTALEEGPPAALSDRDQSVVLVSGAVGVGIGALTAWIAGLATWAAVSGALTLLATLVMAGAAIAAFGLWRSQLRGGSQHEAAKDVLRVALRAKPIVSATLVGMAGIDRMVGVFGRKVMPSATWEPLYEEHKAKMRAYREELEAANDKVRIVWGAQEVVLEDLVAIVSKVQTVVSIVLVDMAGEEADSAFAYDPIGHATYRAVKGIQGESHPIIDRIEREIQAVDAWAAHFIGRR